MGMVWEASGKGVSLLGGPGNPYKNSPRSHLAVFCLCASKDTLPRAKEEAREGYYSSTAQKTKS